jgi:hypothetical protein
MTWPTVSATPDVDDNPYREHVDKDRYDEFRGRLHHELMAETGFGTVEWLEQELMKDAADLSSPLKDITQQQFLNAVHRMPDLGFTDEEINEGFALMRLGLPASGTNDWSTEHLDR